MPSRITTTPTRREFLSAGTAAATAAALARPAGLLAQAKEDLGLGRNPTPDAVLKFYPDGRLKPFAGNTVICHVPHQSRFMDEARRLREALDHATFATKLGPTPPLSYHMTIFPGANDQARERSSWPGGVPMDASIDACSRALRDRLQDVCLDAPLPYRVVIDREFTLQYGRACTLRMRGADATAERALRSTRDRIADAYRFRSPQHESYTFHITLAYTLQDFSAAEMTEYRGILRTAVDRMAQSTPVLELGLPEFCTFPDMGTFQTELLLRTCARS